MVSRDSVLRKLPGQLDRKQAILFDGLRHAAEMLSLAYARLQSTLTKIALKTNSSEESGNSYTSAFVDAWVVVDSIDRFRTLWQLLQPEAAGVNDDQFKVTTAPIRNLRNVADHLSARLDYVVAKNGSALGTLSWLTVVSEHPPKVLSCAIIPGTLHQSTPEMHNPSGKSFEIPSGEITLAAGEYSANLSEAVAAVQIRVMALEKSLSQYLKDAGYEGEQAGADLLITILLEANNNQSPHN